MDGLFAAGQRQGVFGEFTAQFHQNRAVIAQRDFFPAIETRRQQENGNEEKNPAPSVHRCICGSSFAGGERKGRMDKQTDDCTFVRRPHTAGMELDLVDVTFDLRDIKPRELEEAFEDPFSVRLLPDHDRLDGSSRYYLLGRTVADRYFFASFRTDGKVTRVVAAREMSEVERKFYDRKYAEFR